MNYMKNVFLAGCLGGLLAVSGSASDQCAFFAAGPKGAQAVSLSFDDGPGPHTEAILSVLANYQVKATFFMEGSQVEARGPLAKKVFDAGHEAGIHLYSHPDFYHYKKNDAPQVMERELVKTEQLVEKSSGKKPRLLRMPHGYMKPWSREIAGAHGYTMVNWTFGCDWKKMSGEELAAAYIKNIKPGAILLMHDGGKYRGTTVEALPRVIEEIRKKGLKIVTVGELLGVQK